MASDTRGKRLEKQEERREPREEMREEEAQHAPKNRNSSRISEDRGTWLIYMDSDNPDKKIGK